ncbi:MAG TPA: MFS transporter [Burkholderiales bacterium]|nr:MFS transporter [Burkholderiales bacterium]
MPELRSTVVASIAGRLPIGIAGLAILLFVQGRSGSFALAGTASALYVLGLGAVAPFLGRLIDRLGPRPVLGACAVLYPAALIGLALLVLRSAPLAWICGASIVAGATLPPISACMRALYPRMMREPALLQTAYSVDSGLVEAVFILGPAIVAACVALGYPEAAVLLAALSAAAGTAVFLAAPAVRRWTAAPVRPGRDWVGVLRYPKLVIVFAVTVLYAFAFGLFEVAVTAHTAAKGAPAMAGIALALASVGSGAGAFVYGSRHWQTPLNRQLVGGLTAMCAGMLLLVPVDHLGVYAAASLIAGVPMATVIATQSLLVSTLAPRERLAESFTWSTTCLLVGISAGIAAGGVLAEGLAAYWLLVIAGGSTALAAACAAAAIR